jgi:hypothetical protein
MILLPSLGSQSDLGGFRRGGTGVDLEWVEMLLAKKLIPHPPEGDINQFKKYLNLSY